MGIWKTNSLIPHFPSQLRKHKTGRCGEGLQLPDGGGGGDAFLRGLSFPSGLGSQLRTAATRPASPWWKLLTGPRAGLAWRPLLPLQKRLRFEAIPAPVSQVDRSRAGPSLPTISNPRLG